MTAQELNRDVSAAKRAAHDGPVFITSRGEVTHVLLDIDYYRAQARPRTLYDAVHPAWLNEVEVSVNLDLEPRTELPRAAEFD